MQKHRPKWRPLRLESSVSLGVPDVLIAVDGAFGMWELKVTHANAVRISPHQISFAESHRQYPVWFLVCVVDPVGERVLAYHARDVQELARVGVKHPPQLEITPPSWDSLFALICP